MHIQLTPIKKLTIGDLQDEFGLDPITAWFEDRADGERCITLECTGQRWSAAWHNLGTLSADTFLIQCKNSMVADNFTASKPGTPAHDYLCRIIRAVQVALTR